MDKACWIPERPRKALLLPNSTSWSSVMMRMILGRMFLRSLWMRPLKPWALAVVKAQLPDAQSRDSRTTQASHCISMMPEMTSQGMNRRQTQWWDEGREMRPSQAAHLHLCSSSSRRGWLEGDKKRKQKWKWERWINKNIIFCVRKVNISCKNSFFWLIECTWFQIKVKHHNYSINREAKKDYLAW